MLIRRDRGMLAVAVMLDVAFHGGRTATVSAAEIADRLGLARRGMEPLLQALSRGGLLESVRGPRGGYRLARERRRISVGEIVRVVQALEAGEEEVEELPTSDLGRRVIRPMWGALQDDIMKRLDAITVDELCLNAHHSGIVSEVVEKMDFAI